MILEVFFNVTGSMIPVYDSMIQYQAGKQTHSYKCSWGPGHSTQQLQRH